ncbi:serine hydrolase domain-containing protein [Caryophanon tenue]|uniref:Beta-lactamase-related domain-containing protein n=1 Tax=Caryophanon tenue TaxID=33978 RepID=A0A1C0YBT5_9BACL|nr:serine hydrolase domain-containing protein [Caryophanon tenue]OCS84593.1 hypothetical protein A6M13_03170 [Caryophanon tenue]
MPTFTHVVEAFERTYQTLHCSGAALMVFHDNVLQVERYWGTQSANEQAQPVQPHTKFHLASCRKSYIAFAVAYAIYHGYIRSLDDDIRVYLPKLDQKECYKGITVRHLVTHSHGLTKQNGDIVKEFEAGTAWAYRGVNIDLLSSIIQHTTNKTIAEIVQDVVFTPLQFKETNWYNTFDETFVEVIDAAHNRHWSASDNIDGSQMNMYASARELAKWGLLHLNEGMVAGQQLVEPAILQLATTLQSPSFQNCDTPENGILWFVKATQAQQSEIGALVPNGSFQISGYTTVTLLVIPAEQIVAVRAFNSFGNPAGYDYLHDVRHFGDCIMTDLA